MLENISGLMKNTDINSIADKKTNTFLNKTNSSNLKNSQSNANKIVLVSKGEAGYIPSFDIDGDGVVTLDEFNQYCSENGVSEEDKLKLMATIQSAKTTEKLKEESEKAKKESDKEVQETQKQESAEEKSDSIYARKGEKKYDERMDENNDAVVTYEEYRKYCEKASKESESSDNASSTQEEKQIKEAYKEPKEEPEYSVEAEA